MPTRRQWKRNLFVAAVLVLMAAFLIYYFDRSENLPDVILLPSGPLQAKEGGFVDRLMPERWIGVHNFWARLRGPPKLVEVHWKVFKDPETLGSLMKANSLGPPLLSTNGHAFWIISDRKLKVPAEDIEDWMEKYYSIVSSGCDFTSYDRRISETEESGIMRERWSMFPRLGNGKIDLSTFTSVARAHRPSVSPEDLLLSVRAQLPFGKSLLCIDDSNPESANGRWVVQISANLDTNAPRNLGPPSAAMPILP